jgi:uncharacterized protein
MPDINWSLIFLQTLIGTVMVLSLFAMLIPGVPGLVIIWGAALFFGLMVGFNWLAWVEMVLLTILMLFGSVIDNIITAKKAYDSGAATLSIIAGVIAGILGAIFWTPIGGLITAPLGVLAAEYWRLRSLRQAAGTTKGWLVGLGWAFFIRFLTGMAMIGLWLIWAINAPH